MDECSGYARDLSRVMAEELDEAERRRLIHGLREHGGRCQDCHASLELVEVLALPPDDRPAPEDPPARYWADFNSRLERRIAAQATDAVRPAHPWRWAGAAAAVLAAGLCTWILLGRLIASPAEPGARERSVAELPAGLVEGLASASPAELEALAGWSGTGELGADVDETGLFPEIEELDAGERQALLSWLRSQAS